MPLLRYWHTLRHLRPVQFYGRLWFRLYRPRPARPEQLALEARNLGRTAIKPGQTTFSAASSYPFPCLRPVSMLGPARFRFLNQTHDAVGPEAWNDPTRDKLWLYNLHYFDDLNAADTPNVANALNVADVPNSAVVTDRAAWRRALVQRWISENPPGQGNGWEPYPTSLRIVNWVKWLLRVSSIPRASSVASAGTTGTAETAGTTDAGVLGNGTAQPPNALILTSLATQAHWLRRRLEYHLLGNHLFANAKALVFAGAFFVGPEAERWLRLGQRLLRRELQEQILADGGHFERSPMYHAILLEDVLDLMQLAQVYPETLDAALLNLCDEKAAAMQRWLTVMTHPDGQISFFNDAAFGIAPTLEALVEYAQGSSGEGKEAVRQEGSEQRCSPHVLLLPNRSAASLPSPLHLRESGYVRLEAGPAVALLDVAPIGPDYLPGHAHADTLSFELSLFGQRVIVNGGTSVYGTGPERLAERGTSAHSTVQIDGADSSEVWGGFRVARRARPFDVMVSTEIGTDHVFVDSDRKPGQTTFSPLPSFQPGSRNPLQGQQPRSRHITDSVYSRLGALQGKRGPSPVLVSAAHDGYRRLPGKPVHRREWRLAAGRLVVTDRIEGECRSAVARFHLHPQVEGSIEPSSGKACGTLRLADGACIRWRVTGGHPRLVPDSWHPEFGRSVPSQCLEVVITADECALELSWAASGM